MSNVIGSLSGSTTGSANPAGSTALGKNEFLKLLTAQLASQDPLAPMDSQAFVAQLAQFASVEQLEGVGARLDTMLVAQASSNQLGAASLVGKEILHGSDRVSLPGEGAAATFAVTLEGASDEGVAILSDASGRVVRTLSLGAGEAGTRAVAWDGLDESGRKLPAGEYHLVVAATKDGEPVGSRASVRGTATGVTFESGAPELLVNGRRVRLADVIEIASTTSP